MQTITIIGGGLAGLALGIGLRQAHVPVTLIEASSYPRHRVCGEFICGVQADTLKHLGILHHFVDAEQCNTTSWYHHGSMVYQKNLPVAAFGISRYLLDYRLSRNFRKLGGELIVDTRFTQSRTQEGHVWTVGRLLDTNSPWIGLSLHCEHMQLTHDLEIHFGRHCYVGLTRIEDNIINLCGLFKKRPTIKAKKKDLPLAYLQACGLQQLAKRIQDSTVDPNSVIGVSNLNFQSFQPSPHRLALGDHFSMIPPFTGNGMSMAFESAEVALDPLAHYARGTLSWKQAQNTITQRLHKRFKKRLSRARLIHPIIYSPRGQAVLVKLASTGCLPFGKLFRATH